MVLPRTLMWSTLMGLRPLGISLTAFKCVFMATSTPATIAQHSRVPGKCGGERGRGMRLFLEGTERGHARCQVTVHGEIHSHVSIQGKGSSKTGGGGR